MKYGINIVARDIIYTHGRAEHLVALLHPPQRNLSWRGIERNPDVASGRLFKSYTCNQVKIAINRDRDALLC